MQGLKQQIETELEHYTKVDVVLNKASSEGVVNIPYPVSKAQLYRYLLIIFGQERVSKPRGKIVVTS